MLVLNESQYNSLYNQSQAPSQDFKLENSQLYFKFQDPQE